MPPEPPRAVPATTAASASAGGARRWLALAALTLPVLMISMDNTVLTFALPTLSADLQPSGTELLWIVDIYSFMLAGLLVIMGNLGDRIGRRRLLLAGAAAFSVASVLAAFAPDPRTLIAARALLGVAGATLMPSTLSLLRNIFLDDRERRLAVAVWITMFSVGGVLGPVVGGWMLGHLWWGSVFLLGVPVSAGLLVVGPIVVPESRDPQPGRWDPASAGLALAAMLPFVYGIKSTATEGVGPVALVGVLVGVAAGVAFVRRQRRTADPMIDVALFTSARFRAAVVTNLVVMFAFSGALYFLTQYLQVVGGLSPLQAGLVLVPGMVCSLSFTLSAGRLAVWLSVPRATTVGMFMVAAGMLTLATVSASGDSLQVAVSFALVGGGASLATALMVDAILTGLPPHKAGAGAAVSETGFELGIALGAGLLGTVGLAVYRGRLDDASLPGVPPGALHAARETLGGAVDAADGLGGSAAGTLLDAARVAFRDGLRASSLCGAAVIVVAAVLSGRALRRPDAGAPESGGPPEVSRSEVTTAAPLTSVDPG